MTIKLDTKDTIQSILASKNWRQPVYVKKIVNGVERFFKHIEYVFNNPNRKKTLWDFGCNKKSINNINATTGEGEMAIAKNINKEVCSQLAEIENNVEINITFGNNSYHLSGWNSVCDFLLSYNANSRKQWGGDWSKFGKDEERSLALEMLNMAQVPKDNYSFKVVKGKPLPDVYLISNLKKYLWEIKLSGIGNTESAKSAIADDAWLLTSAYISNPRKATLISKGINYIDFSVPNDYKRFSILLNSIGIPAKPMPNVKDHFKIEQLEVVEQPPVAPQNNQSPSSGSTSSSSS